MGEELESWEGLAWGGSAGTAGLPVLGDDVEAGMVKKSAQTLRNSPTLPFLGFVAGFAVNAVSSNDRHLKSFL